MSIATRLKYRIKVFIILCFCSLGMNTSSGSNEDKSNASNKSIGRPENELLVGVPGFVATKNSEIFEFTTSILKAIYEPAGYQLKVYRIPFARLLLEVAQCKYDLIPAIFRLPERQTFLHYPNIRIWTDYTSIFYKPEVFADGVTVDILDDRRIITLRGYDLEWLLPEARYIARINNHRQGIGMVMAGRADGFIVNSNELRHEVNEYNLAPDLYKLEQLGERPLFPAFCHSDHGRKLAVTFDEGIQRLYESGELLKIYRKFDREWMFGYPEFENNR